MGYGKLTQQASATSSSHHREVRYAMVIPHFHGTATTEARSLDRVRSDSFAHGSAHPVFSNEGAPTYALGIITGVLAVFVRSSTPSPRRMARQRRIDRAVPVPLTEIHTMY